jgi:3-hydroxyisobutyrate dehydrogenase-like beta-hydroxyacid dehydrogenase
MFKDFGLILGTAMELSVPMPATAAVIRAMERLAGVEPD